MCLKLIVAITLLMGVVRGGAAATQATLAGPPPGLTPYGRVVWNLDALLHDTFGSHAVYENFAGNSRIPNFSTRFTGAATSVPYVYTFAVARHSAFRSLRPTHPPRIGNYVTGSNIPFKIRGAYISCGNGKWLYGRSGQAFSSGDTWCSKTPIAP